MKTDIEIAQSCPLLPITAIGAKLGLTEEQLECYGRYKAKLLPSATVGKPQSGKLILVTAINPTAAGEGKTTTSIGLADSLSALGKKTVLALREPSLGPVFGLNLPAYNIADRVRQGRYLAQAFRHAFNTFGRKAQPVLHGFFHAVFSGSLHIPVIGFNNKICFCQKRIRHSQQRLVFYSCRYYAQCARSFMSRFCFSSYQFKCSHHVSLLI